MITAVLIAGTCALILLGTGGDPNPADTAATPGGADLPLEAKQEPAGATD